MPFEPFRSERLVYRAVETPEDDAFFQTIANDVSGYHNSNYDLAVPQSKKKAAEYQKRVAEEALLGVVFCVPKTDNEPGSQQELIPIGTVHLDAIKSMHIHHRITTLTIDVIPEYQGKGYGSEAITWALRWAFESANLHKVKIGVLGYNPRAKQLYEILGFKLEATMREDTWFQGQWYDNYWLGMLEREWRANQDKLRQTVQ